MDWVPIFSSLLKTMTLKSQSEVYDYVLAVNGAQIVHATLSHSNKTNNITLVSWQSSLYLLY